MSETNEMGGRTGKVNPKNLGETPCNLNPVFCVPPETFFQSFQYLDGGEKSQTFCLQCYKKNIMNML